mgnify:CR=1 FL=1
MCIMRAWQMKKQSVSQDAWQSRWTYLTWSAPMWRRGGAYNYAASQGIPSILIERGGMGAWTSEEVRSTRRDVRNILCHLGIYQGKKDYRTYYPLDVTDICYQDASRDGLWYPFKKPGDMIREGEILGEVRDYEGGLLELSVAEYDGVILYQTGTLQVLGDGPMIAYGKDCQSL